MLQQVTVLSNYSGKSPRDVKCNGTGVVLPIKFDVDDPLLFLTAIQLIAALSLQIALKVHNS